MPEVPARALRPDDLFALKYVHDARLSPDSRRVAYVISRTEPDSKTEVFAITIEDLTSGTRREVAFPGDASSPRWAPDGRHLAFVGTHAGSSRLYLSDADAGDVTAMTPADAQVQGAPSWSPNSSSIAYTVVTRAKPGNIRRVSQRVFRSEGLGVVDGMTLSIQLLDVERRTTRPLDIGLAVAMQPAFSPCGRRILLIGADAPFGYPAPGLRLLIRDLDSGETTQVLGGGRWSIASAAWSPCGERVVIAGDYASALTVPMHGIWVVNRDGTDPQCRTTGVMGCVGVLAHHDMPTWTTSQNHTLSVPDAQYAYASVTSRGSAEICRVALDGPIRCEPVVSGSRTCVIMDADCRSSRLLYAATDLNSPWELYVSSLEGAGERRLTRLNDSVLARWPALKVQHLSFQSSDGLALEGWHLMRADRSGEQPTVMFIHGGPELNTGHAFRFDFHLLAANGYAVLFANFRGSSGYGTQFRRAIQGDWGARAFPDHMATTDAAIARGLADARRLGVWGASHGGFATSWIVGHTTRFRAAVAESSVTNFTTLYYLSDIADVLIHELGGRPDEIPDVYRSRSPLTYAARCRTPTLMIHGEEDLRCPIAESEQFYRALHDAGCTTEMVRIPGMTHMGDSTGPLAARLTQNEALLDWFERHL